MPLLLHLSDLHFGHPEVPEAIAAIARRFVERRWNVIAVSGDLTQRNRRSQFVKARAFVQQARVSAPTVAIPGNHDVAWWWNPCGLGATRWMYGGYRRWISADLEPTLRSAGASVVSVNTSHGIRLFTLTKRLRDLSVVGAIQPAQRARAARELALSPAGDLRVLMVHHNVLRGALSNRWGLTSRERGLDDVAATGCELVLCGHDHEGQVAEVERGGRRFVVSQANTVSTRARAGRPISFHEIEWEAATITVTRQEWHNSIGDFVEGPSWSFAR